MKEPQTQYEIRHKPYHNKEKRQNSVLTGKWHTECVTTSKGSDSSGVNTPCAVYHINSTSANCRQLVEFWNGPGANWC